MHALSGTYIAGATSSTATPEPTTQTPGGTLSTSEHRNSAVVSILGALMLLAMAVLLGWVLRRRCYRARSSYAAVPEQTPRSHVAPPSPHVALQSPQNVHYQQAPQYVNLAPEYEYIDVEPEYDYVKWSPRPLADTGPSK